MPMNQTYSEKLKDPRWQKLRLQTMDRDGWKCRICGTTGSTLSVHHLRYAQTGNPWDVESNDLATICQSCHLDLHAKKIGCKDIAAGFNRAYADGLLANDTESLTKAIEDATAQFVAINDELDAFCATLSRRLFRMMQESYPTMEEDEL